MHPIHAILIVIIRVWAANAVITVITYFSVPLFYNGVEEGDVSLKINYIFNSVLWFISGGAAWFLAPTLAKKVYPNAHEDSVNTTIDADALVMLGSFLIGGFYLVQYVPSLLTYISIFLVENSRQDWTSSIGIKNYSPPFNLERFCKEALIIGASLWMTLRPAHIARLFSYLRQVGLYKKDVGN